MAQVIKKRYTEIVLSVHIWRKHEVKFCQLFLKIMLVAFIQGNKSNFNDWNTSGMKNKFCWDFTHLV